jgi:hypothetical protein
MLSLLERVNQPAITLVFIKVINRQIQINYRALTSFYLAFNNAMAETKLILYWIRYASSFVNY